MILQRNLTLGFHNLDSKLQSKSKRDASFPLPKADVMTMALHKYVSGRTIARHFVH
jgi:hypothetical protein